MSDQPIAKRAAIIYVAATDDPDSVLRRLRQTGGSRTRLVVGRRGSPMATPVDLKRLAMQLREYPADVELVSRHRDVRGLARSAGIRASSSLDGRPAIRRLAEYPIRATMRTFKIGGVDATRGFEADHYGVPLRAILAGPVLLAGMAIAAIWSVFYFLLPTTTVAITRTSMDRSVEIEALADPSARFVNVEPAIIPGRIVEVEIQGFRSIRATGRELVAGARSSGVAILRNLTAGSVLVPKGTVVSTTDGIRYSTAANLELPAGLTGDAEDEPAGLQVAVAAVDGGSEANVVENSVATVEGPLRFSVQVLSSTAMTGGTDREVSRASELDRIELRRLLLEELLEEGVLKLQTSGPSSELVNVWPVGALNPTVVESTFAPPSEVEDFEVELEMRIKVFGTVFSRIDANRLVDTALAAERSGGESDFEIAANSVVYGEPVIDRVSGGRVAMRLTGRGMVIQRVDTDEIERNLLDINVEEAETYLASVEALSDYEIERWGPLTDRTARLPFRVQVRLVERLEQAR